MKVSFPLVSVLVFVFGSFWARGQDVVVSEFMASNETTVIPGGVTGEFPDWIELENRSGESVDLGGWRLTDDGANLTKWTFPAGTIMADGDFLVVRASGEGGVDGNGNLRTNFRLRVGGEVVILVRPDGKIASEYGEGGEFYPAQTPDVSYGRHPVTGQAVYFTVPTPGVANDAGGAARVAELEVFPSRGYYDAAQVVTLTTPTPGARIYYTTNGSSPLNEVGNPVAGAMEYLGPISVGQTTVLRAAARATGFLPTKVVAHTYLLLDIAGAAANGVDPGGFNIGFLRQTKPANYGNLASGDYNMDGRVSQDTAASVGHDGLSVSQAMLQGMREVPTISISMAASDFVFIYANPTQEGDLYEKGCAAEFIPAVGDSREGFFENCGLRVQGGASRIPDRSPKHGLSFRFREQYGEGRLREELFADVPVRNFNSIALRAVYNNSWIHSDAGQRSRAGYIRDQWMRESLREMGHEDAGAGFLAHVFVNGLYWGLHNVAERQDNVHYAEYHGGDSDMIDARNGAIFVEGNATAWNAMRSVVATKNWEDIQKVLDIDNYIDFQLIQRFGANADLKVDGNWRAAGGGPFTVPTEMRPWKLYSWDAERVLEDQNASNVPLDPMNIRGTLETMPEYRLRFADRAYRHLNGKGALTSERTRERWEKYADGIDKAVIAESARWGDHRRPAQAYGRTEWLTERSRLNASYFPNRTNNVQSLLNASNLYPKVEPPSFAIDGEISEGGYVGPGSILRMNAGTGMIYYTLDGNDPALPDGSIRPSAFSLESGTASEEVFAFESMGWQYLDTGVAQSASDVVVGDPSYGVNDWKHPDFAASGWKVGQGLLAGRTANAIDGRTANTVIDIGPSSNGYPTVYFRKEFQLNGVENVVSVALSIVRDDGVIVYLNGKEIFRNLMPAGTVNYGDFATANAVETDILQPTYAVAPGDLLEGTNVLAVEVHNRSAGSSDLGLDVAMEVARTVGNPTVELASSALVTARFRAGTAWSAPVAATFLVEEPASSGTLAISEINYHPREATLLEWIAAGANAGPFERGAKEEFEFLELVNDGGAAINLSGVRFVEGIEVELGLFVLEAGERAILVRDEAAFLARYGSELAGKIAGVYAGQLSNSGETLTLIASDGSVIESLIYGDSGAWPTRADGDGSSLERVNLSANGGDPKNWVSSVLYDGSPGEAGELFDGRVVVNEVSTNSTRDFIELHNRTDEDLQIGGWLLTDSKKVYRSFVLPETTLPAGGYVSFGADQYDAGPSGVISGYRGTPGAAPTVVDAVGHGLNTGDWITIKGYSGISGFNGTFEVLAGSPDSFTIEVVFLDDAAVKGTWERGRSFGLSANSGDDLWLVETDGHGIPVRFVDRVEFRAALPEVTLGRWPDGGGNSELISMTADTEGAANSGPVLGPVYLSEIFYDAGGNDLDEFVELKNTSAAMISLQGWQLRGGMDFDFTAAHSLGANGVMVVVFFDPALETTRAAEFRARFGIGESVVLVGPAWDGPLNDLSGTVRLQKAGLGASFPQITADAVDYRAASVDESWPAASGGFSLNRTSNLGFGHFAESWTAAEATPGDFASGLSYDDWAEDLGVGGKLDDDDGDGFSNFLEFAMGTDPKALGEGPVMLISGNEVEVVFPSRLDRAGVTLVIETSVDLIEWSERVTQVIPVSEVAQGNRLVIDRLDETVLFWRLLARTER